jgi:hypothetical protein
MEKRPMLLNMRNAFFMFIRRAGEDRQSLQVTTQHPESSK